MEPSLDISPVTINASGFQLDFFILVNTSLYESNGFTSLYKDSLDLDRSIPVEGHIIASTINKKRFFGILIALSALCFQFLIQNQILNQS